MLISAGTIAAYLALDSTKFNRSLGEAMQLLANFAQSGGTGKTAMEEIGFAAGSAADKLNGPFSGALRQSAGCFWQMAQSYVLSASDASLKVTDKVDTIKKSLLSIGDSAPAAGAKSQAVAAAIKAPFRELSSSAYSIMSNVGAGLNRGLADKKSVIVSTARSIANTVTGTIRSVLKIASPSKVMRQIGEQTVQGLVIGMGNDIKNVEKSADALAGSITGGKMAGLAADSIRSVLKNVSTSDIMRQTAVQTVQGISADLNAGMQYLGNTADALAGNIAAGSSPVGVPSDKTSDISFLAEKLDSIISLISSGQQVMNVDGRVFARLIKEYS